MFKVGDKVKVIKSQNIGFVGEVIWVSGDGVYGVKFKNSSAWLHSCEDECECGHGWYYKEDEIILLKEKPRKFTKSDLENGDVIIHRDDSIGIYIENMGIILYQDGYNAINDYNDNFESECDGVRDEDSEYDDIVKVYRPNAPYQCSYIEECYTKGVLVYNRDDEPIPMTLSQICEELGKNIYIVEE